MDRHPEQPSTESQDVIAGVRFQPTGKVYHFDASGVDDLQPGDFALVETVRGQQLGEVVCVRSMREDENVHSLKPVKRRASGRDMALRQRWQEKEDEALSLAEKEASALGLPVKFAVAEYTFDGGRLTLLYSSEEDHPDLEKLEQRLQQKLETNVELLKVGPRDQAKLIGGCGPCGQVLCCARFLTDFRSISIRMAKKQGVSLHPSAITGMCERLRCCLSYEHEQYKKALRSLPRRKKYVRTPYGEGKVVDLLPLKDAVVVRIDDRRLEVPAEEVKVIPRPEG